MVGDYMSSAMFCRSWSHCHDVRTLAPMVAMVSFSQLCLWTLMGLYGIQIVSWPGSSHLSCVILNACVMDVLFCNPV